MAEFEISKDKVVLSENLFADYEDAAECFGNTVKGEGYSETDTNCTPANCDLVEPCKLLCRGVPACRFGDESIPEEAKAEVSVEEAPTNDMEFDRDSVKCLVINTLNNLKLSPEVVSSATRDKVFIGEENKFIITKRALRLPDVEDGSTIGLSKQQWTAANKGIDIPFDAGVQWVEVTQAVMGKKVSFNKPVEPEEKATLFQQDTPDTTDDIEDVPKVVPETPEAPLLTSGSFEVAPGLEVGKAVKSLQLLKYDNGYSEVRVTFVTDVVDTTDILATLRKAFE